MISSLGLCLIALSKGAWVGHGAIAGDGELLGNREAWNLWIFHRQPVIAIGDFVNASNVLSDLGLNQVVIIHMGCQDLQDGGRRLNENESQGDKPRESE